MEKMIKRGKAFSVYSGLPSSIYVLFIVRVITSAASFITPFLSIYLTTKLGFGKGVAGLVLATNTMLGFIAILLGGYLADKYNRKNIILLTGLGRLSCLLLILGIDNIYVKAALLLIMSFVSTISHPAEDTLVVDLTNREQQRTSFSLLYLGLNIGVSVSAMVAGFLFNSFINLMFVGEATITVIALLLVYKYIQVPSGKKQETATLEPSSHTDNNTINFIQALKLNAFIPIFLFVMLVFAFVYNQFSFALPVHLSFLFKDNGAVFYGTLMTINCLCVVLLTPFITKITKKIPTALNMVIAGGLYCFGFGMYYLAKDFTLIIILTIVWTVGEVISSTNFVHYVSTHSPEKYRGRIISFTSACMRLGAFLNPIFVGMFIKNYSTSSVWLMTSTIMGIATLLMLYLYSIERTDKKINYYEAK
ncbi:MFS transporter [Priestia flexa]|uniref:MFS transporter n=1 Tax=Priestia flexa TaxID=86664 RepID=UPI002DBDC866|nr:MFS transporter [Priestia flexa]MEC0665833.1 MFS transporter [Priestia flexa]